MIIDIKADKLVSFLQMLKRSDFLTDNGIQEIEGIELSEIDETLAEPAVSKGKEEIIASTQKYFQEAGLPVEKVWLFGSFARGEQNSSSDIDLMVRFSPGAKIDLWDFAGIIQDLEEALGSQVDLVREGGAKPFAASNVEKDQILVYEKETKK